MQCSRLCLAIDVWIIFGIEALAGFLGNESNRLKPRLRIEKLES